MRHPGANRTQKRHHRLPLLVVRVSKRPRLCGGPLQKTWHELPADSEYVEILRTYAIGGRRYDERSALCLPHARLIFTGNEDAMAIIEAGWIGENWT